MTGPVTYAPPDFEVGGKFPWELTWRDVDLSGMAEYVLGETAQYLRSTPYARGGVRTPLIRPGESVGGFISNPEYAGRYNEVWDDPGKLIGAFFGYGPQRALYAWNAARKGRAVARTGRDLHLIPVSRFRNPVKSAIGRPDEEADLQWGDFGLDTVARKAFGGRSCF